MGLTRGAKRLAEAEPALPDLTYTSLFLLFLRLGASAFGGPVAQVAMIHHELVEARGWIETDHFNRLLAVLQVLPGPEAHELCVHLGVRAKGRIGGLLAGLGFMAPGLTLMLLLAWLYTRLPLSGTALGAAFLGAQAIVLALVTHAVYRIGRHALLDRTLCCVAIGSATATALGVSFWITLTAAGAAYSLALRRRFGLLALTLSAASAAAAVTFSVEWKLTLATPQASISVLALFLAGLKGGLLTFGGAYTAIPFIRADTVARGWVSDGQFLDGVSFATVLPAPLVVFATFAGWMSAGLPGALAITAGIFLPAFAFSLLFYERLEAVLHDSRLLAALTGVAAAVVGMVATTAVQLAGAAAVRTPNIAISAALLSTALAIVFTWRSRWAAPVLLGCGAAIGSTLLR